MTANALRPAATDSRGRWARRAAVVAGVAVAAAAVGVARGRRRFRREIQDHVVDLLSDARSPGGQPFEDAALEDLPAPVRRYFETVLEVGQRPVRTVRLHQQGAFRLGGADAPWRPLEATEHFTVSPPGFVWEARIDVAPLVPVRVVDLYRGGEGLLRARLFSAVPVAEAGPGPAMNEGELLRYLAEAVWFPTALLPAAGVEWEPVDDRAARATLRHRAVTASAVFHFDDRGLVRRVTAERYRQEDDADAPWSGSFRDYEERNGMVVPTAAEVAWNLPDGDLPYWRAELDEVEHFTAAAGED